MDRTLGARLRAHREERHISLEAISAETKIKPFMLEGLENDDVSHWPDGIYRRAYIRAYARVVGLDAEGLVHEFLQAHPDPVVVRPPDATELENPAWPGELSRLFHSARTALPARQGESGTRSSQSPDAAPAARTNETVPEPSEVRLPQPPTLAQAADLCTRLSRARHRADAAAVLEDAAAALGANGLVVWAWSPSEAWLTPSIAHGYDTQQVAAMAGVAPDADNAIAATFRSMEPCVIPRGENPTGAVAVPILSRGECLGVLALEFADGGEGCDATRACAAILAAQLVPHLSAMRLATAATG